MNRLNIKLKDIDWNKKITFYSSSVVSDQLLKSIELYGILCPPLLYSLNNGKYMIVSGWQRLLALSQLQSADFIFEANILSAFKETDRECLNISLSDNLSHRSLDTLEKADFIAKLKNELNIEDKIILNQYFPLLSLNRSAKILNEMLMLSEFTQEQKNQIRNNNYSVEYFNCLWGYNADIRSALVDISLDLNLGVNVIKEISLNIYEISKRDNISEISVLEEILKESEQLSRREKIDYIRETIYKRRYPHISEKKEHMELLIKNCSFPPQIKIKVPSSMEGCKISLSIDIKSSKELLQYIESIKSVDEKGCFNAIWDFMKL